MLLVRVGLLALTAASCCHAANAPIPVDALFSGMRVLDASISPDARYLALILRSQGRTFVAVRDRTTATAARPILAAEENSRVEPRWCHWASSTRLVCCVSTYPFVPAEPVARQQLIAIDADGSHRTVLFARESRNHTLYYQPEVVSWTDQDASHLLASAITIPGGDFVYAYSPQFDHALVSVDIESGGVDTTLPSPSTITRFAADGAGAALLGTGFKGALLDGSFVAFGKVGDAAEWKPLRRLEPHAHDARFVPVAVDTASQAGFMLMDHDGRVALWKVDLTDERDPQPVFWHTEFNVSGVLRGSGERVIGARLGTAAIGPWYTDDDAIHVNESLRRRFPDRWNDIVSASADMKTLVVRSWGGGGTPVYAVVVSRDDGLKIEPIGSEVPELEKLTLPLTETVTVPLAADRRIYAQLTLPLDNTAKAPLIVLVSDWTAGAVQFDGLAKLLASRGFAVLRPQAAQDNRDLRWDLAPFADWGGRRYDDLLAAASWAQKLPRVTAEGACIVGFGYGGYQAMLAATRADNEFKCAVSINGYSDFAEPRGAASRAELGKRAAGNSPFPAEAPPSVRSRAADAHAKILLIHYTDQRMSNGRPEPAEAKAMDNALRRGNKTHRLALVDGIDDAFEAGAYRELLTFITPPNP